MMPPAGFSGAGGVPVRQREECWEGSEERSRSFELEGLFQSENCLVSSPVTGECGTGAGMSRRAPERKLLI